MRPLFLFCCGLRLALVQQMCPQQTPQRSRLQTTLPQAMLSQQASISHGGLSLYVQELIFTHRRFPVATRSNAGNQQGQTQATITRL